MTAQVLTHPALHLPERIEDARREADHAEQLWHDLRDGTRDWTQWNPGLVGCYAPQQIAADEAYLAWQDTLRQLRALEAQQEQTARGARERTGNAR